MTHPKKPCAVCGQLFAPFLATQRHCSKRKTGRRCAYIARSRALAGQTPQKAQARRTALQQEKSRARIRERFGPLSDRDVEVIRFVRRQIWQAGWDACARYYLRRGVRAA